MRYTRSLVLIVALSGIACSSPSDEPSAGDSGDSTPAVAANGLDDGDTGLTGMAGELAAILEANEGNFPLPDALDLFASTFGEIPGGDAARFEGRVDDATMALMAVGAFWEQLTVEQQQAIQGLLGYSSAQPLLTPAASPEDIALQAMVDSARSEIAGLVGTDVSYPITGEMVAGLTAVYGDDPAPRPIGGTALSERDGVFVTSGEIDHCRIRFNSAYTLDVSTVAHEVFHCFQYQLAPDVNTVFVAQRWIVEGSAEWAGGKVGGIDGNVANSFSEWVSNTGSVFGLSHNAIGYYFVLESMGVSPWLVIDEMLATSGIDAVAASGLDPSAVLNRVATSMARRALFTPLPVSGVWDFAAEDVPEYGSRTPFTVTPELPFELGFGRGDFARAPNGVFTLEGGERVDVSIESDVGTLEFFGMDAVEWQGDFHQEFCLLEGGCACGLDGEVDSGLEQGARELILTGAELDAGEVNYSLRIPEPSGAFTDGHWVGTVTSTVLVLSTADSTTTRHETIAAMEFTVENGAVTEGFYGLTFYVEFLHETGATGQGTETIIGVFGGCGFSPQMMATSFAIDAMLHLPDVGPVPLQFETALGGTAAGDTVWVIDPVTDPNRRTGELDPSANMAVIRSAGYEATDIVITFEATLTT